ncbi:hypothetical protein QVD17_11227 [Tagetes erecta]|uniref:FBD domain-containing protein n=1 Tax=Tagetes erecta TaxID=13708 RepID=A0AAD8KU23_TARER|nr:hypothetical protein QVD17_11227 [Tagetes erecta]
MLLRLLSGCPLLKRLTLTYDDNFSTRVTNLFKCLPVLEYLSISSFIASCYSLVPNELPTTLVHLKYLRMECACIGHDEWLGFFVFLIGSFPNLEKLKLVMLNTSYAFRVLMDVVEFIYTTVSKSKLGNAQIPQLKLEQSYNRGLIRTTMKGTTMEGYSLEFVVGKLGKMTRNFTLYSDGETLIDRGKSTIIDLFKCLPVIEYLSLSSNIVECFVPQRLPKKLPTTLIHLKGLFLNSVCFSHKYGLHFLALLIRSSPNLEKLQLDTDTLEHSRCSAFPFLYNQTLVVIFFRILGKMEILSSRKRMEWINQSVR